MEPTEPTLGPIDAVDLSAEYVNAPAETAAKYAKRRVAVRMQVGEVSQTSDAVDLIQHTRGHRVVFKVPAEDAALVSKGESPTVCTGSITYTSGGTVFLKGRVDR